MGATVKSAPTAACKASAKPFSRGVEDSLLIDLYSLRSQDTAPRMAVFSYQRAAQKAPRHERVPHKLNSLQAEAYARMNAWEPLSPAFSARELKATFRRLVKRMHPDHGGNSDDFRSLRSAYRELSLIFRDATAI